MRTAPLHLMLLRCILGWVLALQPMVFGARAAEAINSPFAMDICRGSVPGKNDSPADHRSGHDACCLAGCTISGGAVRAEAEPTPLPRPGLVAIADRSLRADPLALPNAGLGPQSARAPPL